MLTPTHPTEMAFEAAEGLTGTEVEGDPATKAWKLCTPASAE
jgi:hypothetical protein